MEKKIYEQPLIEVLEQCTSDERQRLLEKLAEYGIEAKRCGEGVTATIGNGGKTLLLRADMDALPFPEDSGEPFAATNGHSHSCGHDMHTAWLLGAARMLKENEAALEGTVKFMWQPGEETFQGSKAMLADGVLEGVDAAMACHAAAETPCGNCGGGGRG